MINVRLTLLAFLFIKMPILFAAEFKVAFFNVDAIDSGKKWFQKSKLEYPSFGIRLTYIVKMIAKENPGIIAFSEAAFNLEHVMGLAKPLKALGYNQVSDIPGFLSKISIVLAGLQKKAKMSQVSIIRNSGLIIFVHKNHKLISSDSHTFKAKAGRDWISNKGALLCTVAINRDPDKTIKIVLTHLQAGNTENFIIKEKNARLNQMQELVEFIKEHSSSEDSILLGGDFNCQSSSREELHLRSLLTPLKMSNLFIKKPLITSTCHGWKAILDHVYASKNLFNDAELEVVSAIETQDNLYASDHRMIVVTINVP